MEDSFTYVNRLYEEVKLEQVKNEKRTENYYRKGILSWNIST